MDAHLNECRKQSNSIKVNSNRFNPFANYANALQNLWLQRCQIMFEIKKTPKLKLNESTVSTILMNLTMK